MARKEAEYITLKLRWEREFAKIKSNWDLDFFKTKLNSSQQNDYIYSYFTKNKFDEKGFEFVRQSASIDTPISEKEFFKKYIHRTIDGKKINILDNIDNKASADRVIKRLNGEIGILQGRTKRLQEYASNATREGVDKNIWDVKRILSTNKTNERHLQQQILSQKKILKNKSLTIVQRKEIEQNLKVLTNQFKITITSNKEMNKVFSKFEKSYPNMSPHQLEKEYKKVLSVIEKDIVTNQQRIAIEQALDSSASEFTKRTAQTEYVRQVTETDMQALHEMQDKVGDDEMLLVKWTLSDSRDIIDICDDYHDNDIGYGEGVYPLDGSPIPIEDTHPNCRCRLVPHKIVEWDKGKEKEAEKAKDQIYKDNFPSKGVNNE
jgi:hypothetical protein